MLPYCHVSNITNSCSPQQERFLYLRYIEFHPAMLLTLSIHAASSMNFFSTYYILKFMLSYCHAAWNFSLYIVYWRSCCDTAMLLTLLIHTASSMKLLFYLLICSLIYWSSWCHGAMLLTVPVQAANSMIFFYYMYKLKSKMISNDQELIQSDPTSCPQNQKGNNWIHTLTAVYKRHSQ